MIVAMRGEADERNPWQVPMGRITADNLRLAGAAVHEVADAGAAATAVEAAARTAFGENAIAAVLLEQRMLGAKLFQE
jgi:sulfopyruvate decarboxylase TPP-binding subunit